VPAEGWEMAGNTPPTTRRSVMLYMVVERFKGGAVGEIYERFRKKGRMMPAGLEYVSSWIDLDLKTCYQLMRTDDVSLFRSWTENWDDFMDFEIVPVRTSGETAQLFSEKT
jgi:hypothetical protein